MKTLPDVCQQTAEQFGDNIAIIEDDRQITYAELNELRRAMAKALLKRGVGRGDRIAIWAPNSAPWIIAACAIQTIGAVLVPVNTRLGSKEVVALINESKAKILFTVKNFLGVEYVEQIIGEKIESVSEVVLMQGEHPACLSWEQLLCPDENSSDDELDGVGRQLEASDVADLLFTSGSTGKPKGVLTTHGQNIRAFGAWVDIVGLSESDTYILIGPFSHNFGYKGGWLAAMMAGATMLPVPAFEAEVVLQLVQRYRATILAGPPTLFQSLVKYDLHKRYDIHSLRLAVTGATAIPESTIHTLMTECGFERVVIGYGMTEAGVVTLTRPDDPPERMVGTVGAPIPGVDVKIVDSEGCSLAKGEHGEICIRGYTVLDSYHTGEHDIVKAVDAQGWFHTGDLGYINADGYLVISGRIKEMYIAGGFNCYPVQIENVLLGMPGVHQCAVVGVPDARMGEAGFAYVSPMAGETLDAGTIRRWCQHNMANYKVPKHVKVVDHIPINGAGKLDKLRLVEIAKALLQI